MRHNISIPQFIEIQYNLKTFSSFFFFKKLEYYCDVSQWCLKNSYFFKQKTTTKLQAKNHNLKLNAFCKKDSIVRQKK